MGLFSAAKQLRKEYYDYLMEKYPYVFHSWKWYDYRKIKLVVYNFLSSYISYFLIKLKIKPNYITAVYALMGIVGGVLLAVPNRNFIFIGIFCFFFRTVFDWCDGTVARVNKEESISGAAFDSYAASVGWISLWAGAGIYLGHSTSFLFYYLAPLIPALFAADLYSNMRETLIYHKFLKDHGTIKNDSIFDVHEKGRKTVIRKIKNFIDVVFQHDAHSIDLILLLIIIEIFTPLRILWLFYISFLVWQFLIFAFRFYSITRGGVAEKELNNLRKIVY